MHIIVVADHRSAARSFTLGPLHIAVAGVFAVAGLIGLILGTVILFQPLAARGTLAARNGISAVADAGPTLNMMSVKLGEMEAQLLRLDAFSNRMSQLLGARGAASRRAGAPGSSPTGLTAEPAGAPAAARAEPHAAAQTLETLRDKLASVASAIEERSGRLNQIESAMVDVRAEARTVPTVAPIQNGSHSSDYGARRDPFNGEASFHPGIDFVAPTGTVFAAAATGVVVSARPVPEYGNMIEIDHGNGLTTRYAHASHLDVHEGELVVKGQAIGRVGSTGRSTGPHLHFEVRQHGQTLNPEKFLQLAS